MRIAQTGLLSSGESNFPGNTSGWLSVAGLQNYDIYKFTGSLMPVGGVHETDNRSQLQFWPNPSSAEAIIKVPPNLSQTNMTLRVTDIAGRELENRRITTVSSRIRLDAAKYTNGIYIIWLTLEDGESAVCRRMVCH